MKTTLSLAVLALVAAAACATPNLDPPDPPVSDAPTSKHTTGKASPTSPLPTSSGASSTLPPAPSSTSTASSSSASGGPPPGGGSVDAGAQARRWKGSLAATTPVQFGGGTECKYRITLEQVTVDVTAAGDAEIVATNVTAIAFEEVLSTPCNNTAIPQHTHYYSLVTASTLASGLSHLELAGLSTNHPQASLVIEGDFSAASPALSLTWHRTDYGPPLDWTIDANVTVKLQ